MACAASARIDRLEKSGQLRDKDPFSVEIRKTVKPFACNCSAVGVAPIPASGLPPGDAIKSPSATMSSVFFECAKGSRDDMAMEGWLNKTFLLINSTACACN